MSPPPRSGRGAGGAGRGAAGGRGAPSPGARRRPALKRGGSSPNTHVVWPPAERSETARDAIERVLREAGLTREFEADVEREARCAAGRAWERAEGEARADLRELPTFTVDPATARDFDDAISAEALADDSVRVWVHIADVAAHVPLGSPLDLEARRRGTSVYLPGTVEPMLPHSLSSGACSLVPGAERLAVTVELLLRGAQVAQASFYRSIVRSDERLDYEQVDRIFASTDRRSIPESEAHPPGHAAGSTIVQRAPEPWGAPLAAARVAAAALQDARERGAALVIDSEEPEFRFDEQGNVCEIAPRPQTESHRLIEHLMIAANEAVARHLKQTQTPCLYRVHERPDPERIRRLVQQLDSLGVSTPPLPDPLLSTQAAELVGEISRRVDAHVRRSGHGRAALSSLVLRSLKQAFYSPKNLGHAGLHSSCYCHFTSPIRRYPDVVCHRALLSSLGADEQITGRRKLVELGEWVSERERKVAALEHKGDDIAACFRLEQLLLEGGYDQVFAGEVTGLIAAGVFVAFGEAFEGMLPVRLLTPMGTPPGAQAGSAGEERDWWTLNEQSTILRGERSGAVVRLGDPILVRVVRVDAAAGRVDLAPAV
ncbi:MAG TPA: RNB domain-containing ribonuclease [Solirubrobacteraceae bacterium]|nr:RNB domain-containing ribonuclease [Solirubrobacteraceae bacterium]